MHLRDFVRATEEYPGAKLLSGLEHGVFYYYVSSSYLEGIVNYTKPVAGVLLERYDVLDRAKAQTIIDTRVVKRIGHPRLEAFEDDVILLCTPNSTSEADGDPNEYYMFWFDRDVSDCCVGRFNSTDTREQVIADFKMWVESLCDRSQQGAVRKNANGCGGWEKTSDWMELPLEYLRGGWITF